MDAVTDDDLMTIGRFAHLSGLSLHALRHYDDVGLLAPAHIDPATGYRRYRRDQVGVARLIRAMRWIDLPIEEIRRIMADNAAATDILAGHRGRLDRQRDLLTAQIGDVDTFLAEGITMPTPQSGCRPCQIKIAVTDMDTAVAFYTSAFDMKYQVIKRTDDRDYSGFMFGDYGGDGFFLLHLLDESRDTDRPGPSTFGLLVEDLDAYHARAVAAGGTEVVPPRDPQGMPRSSAVKDPSGNWIWLYQG